MSSVTVRQRETQTGHQVGHFRCLEDVIEEQDGTTPMVEVVVLDGAAIVHMLKPAAARTFREYTQDVFLPYVEHQLDKA